MHRITEMVRNMFLPFGSSIPISNPLLLMGGFFY